MKLLFVINQPPGSPKFAEAITALLGVSLFGQATGALLLGGANKEILASPIENQLDQILELGIARVLASSQAHSQLGNPQNIELIDGHEIGELIHSAESVVSF